MYINFTISIILGELQQHQADCSCCTPCVYTALPGKIQISSYRVETPSP